MAFSSLSNTLIQVGKAIKKEIFQTLKDNQDDLNTRVLSVEASTNKIVVFDGEVLNAATFTTATGVAFFRAQSAFDITDAKIAIFDKGSISSGTLQIDVEISSDLDFTTNGTSIFTTKPSLDFSTASSYDESTNAAIDSGNNSAVEGDYIKFDISSIPTGLSRFFIYIVGEPS